MGKCEYSGSIFIVHCVILENVHIDMKLFFFPLTFKGYFKIKIVSIYHFQFGHMFIHTCTCRPGNGLIGHDYQCCIFKTVQYLLHKRNYPPFCHQPSNANRKDLSTPGA